MKWNFFKFSRKYWFFPISFREFLHYSLTLLHTFKSAIFSLYIFVILFNLKCSVQKIHLYILIEALSPVAKFKIPEWGI
jgi:hypothetical protein